MVLGVSQIDAHLKDGQGERMGQFLLVENERVATGSLHTDTGQGVHL